MTMVDYSPSPAFFEGDCANYVGPKQFLNVHLASPPGASSRLVGDPFNKSLKEFCAILLSLWVYAESFRVETFNDLPIRKEAAH